MLSEDDRIRRHIISELICHFRIAFDDIDARFGIDAATYFESEIKRLIPLQEDGLVRVTRDLIEVTPRGRLLIRNICMIFDRYLKESPEGRFSKVL